MGEVKEWIKRRQNNRESSSNGWNGEEKGSLKRGQNNSIYLCELVGCTRSILIYETKTSIILWDNKQEKR